MKRWMSGRVIGQPVIKNQRFLWRGARLLSLSSSNKTNQSTFSFKLKKFNLMKVDWFCLIEEESSLPSAIPSNFISLGVEREMKSLIGVALACSFFNSSLFFLNGWLRQLACWLVGYGWGPALCRKGIPFHFFKKKFHSILFAFISFIEERRIVDWIKLGEMRVGWLSWLGSKPITVYSVIWRNEISSMKEAINNSSTTPFHSTNKNKIILFLFAFIQWSFAELNGSEWKYIITVS